ncbi:MAG: nucleotide sugar dehydrogenase [bacterium]
MTSTRHREKALACKIKDRSIRAGIIGLGYVGLPLAVEFAHAGYSVVGIDKDAEKVRRIKAGKSYIPDVSQKTLKEIVEKGLLMATEDFSVLKDLDTVNICVPTPLRKTRDPDVSYIVDAVDKIAEYLHPGQLIILESTTYPGTTEELVLPILEQGGLKVGKDFFLSFSPERVDPGNQKYATRNTPKVVGGVTAACTRLSAAFYANAIDTVVPVSTTRVAEMVKLLENTFRSVNIGLVNELAMMCDKMKINVWEIIDAAATKPFGFMPFYPGPGLGGHCIPIDPFYLSWKAKQSGFEPRFIELAGEVNSKMPHHVVFKVMDAMNQHEKSLKGSRILIMGIAYKKDINDVRESPALDIMKLLQEKGARVAYHDPFIPRISLNGARPIRSVPLSKTELGSYDCVVIVTNHSGIDYQEVARHAALVVDTRNALKKVRGKNIFRL